MVMALLKWWIERILQYCSAPRGEQLKRISGNGIVEVVD
jgi:hypothetical protein